MDKLKKFDIKQRAGEGEYVFGVKDTGSHACYMIYGLLSPGEKGRVIKPGKGHEELVLASRGDIAVTGHFEGLLNEGEAFHIVEDNECFLENKTAEEAVYVIAGGHSGEGHKH